MCALYDKDDCILGSNTYIVIIRLHFIFNCEFEKLNELHIHAFGIRGILSGGCVLRKLHNNRKIISTSTVHLFVNLSIAIFGNFGVINEK